MGTNEVSIHQCKIYLAVKAAPDWITSKATAEKAGVSERTARLHLLRLSEVGLLKQASVFPGYRYRISAKSDKPSRAMLKQIDDACAVFGLT